MKIGIFIALTIIFLSCGQPPEQGWQWVEVAHYGGSTATNNESFLLAGWLFFVVR